MTLEAVERRGELSLDERRQTVITTVRERLLQFPDTEISFQVKNPEITTVELEFTDSEGNECEVGCGPDSLFARKGEDAYGGATGQGIILNPKLASYIDWTRGMGGSARDEDGMELIEKNLERFLPQIEPTAQA